jgi:hypothetical protein
LESRRGIEEAEIAQQILDWAASNLPRFWWGKGKNDGSVYPILDYNDIDCNPFGIWTYGKIEIQFQWLQNKPPFDSQSKRKELLDLLNRIPGVDIPIDAISKRPNIPLSIFKEKESLDQFINILDWIVKEIKSS